MTNGLNRWFPINRRHQGLATQGCGAAALRLHGFQSIGVTKDWRPVGLTIASDAPERVSNQLASPRIGDHEGEHLKPYRCTAVSNQLASPRIGDFRRSDSRELAKEIVSNQLASPRIGDYT